VYLELSLGASPSRIQQVGDLGVEIEHWYRPFFVRAGTHADSLSDLCSLLNGMVASKDLRSAQFSPPDWIFHDRCRRGWSNSLCGLSEWQPHGRSGHCYHIYSDLARDYIWYQDFPPL